MAAYVEVDVDHSSALHPARPAGDVITRSCQQRGAARR
jgi:hypothetical protein